MPLFAMPAKPAANAMFFEGCAVKILHVTLSLLRAGAEQAMVNLVIALQKRGHDCEVAALRGPYDLAPDLEAAGVVVHRLEGRRGNFGALASAGRVARLAREHHIEILHGHIFPSNAVVAMTRRAAPQARRVVTYNNLAYDRESAKAPRARLLKIINGVLMRGAMDGHIGVSAATARSYERHLKLKNICVIPNAIHVDAVHLNPNPDAPEKEAIRARFGIAPEEVLFVLPARFTPEKGHVFLLQALHLLKANSNRRVRALLVGDGPLRAELEAQVRKLNLHDEVVFLSSLPQAELFPLIKASDLFVFSSISEGFPLAPAEAMMLERCVVATRVGGVPDLIEDGISGLLVEPANAPALAGAIERVLSDDALRSRLGRAARARIETHFSDDVIAARIEEFYRSLL